VSSAVRDDGKKENLLSLKVRNSSFSKKRGYTSIISGKRERGGGRDLLF